MTRDEIHKLSDTADNTLSILARAWIEADNYQWPKQNRLQAMAQIEWAIGEYLEMRLKLCQKSEK